MRYQLVEIAGNKLPCRFGFNALSEFCSNTNTSLADLDSIASNMSLESALALIYVGLKDGHRVKCKEDGKVTDFKYTMEDVADLIDEDWDVMAKVFEVFESMMGGKKKKVHSMPKASRPTKK